MLVFCLVCNEYTEINGFEQCGHCGAVGDELIPCEYDEIDEDGFDTYEPTEEDIEAMYQESLARDEVRYKMFIIGAQ